MAAATLLMAQASTDRVNECARSLSTLEFGLRILETTAPTEISKGYAAQILGEMEAAVETLEQCVREPGAMSDMQKATFEDKKRRLAEATSNLAMQTDPERRSPTIDPVALAAGGISAVFGALWYLLTDGVQPAYIFE